MAQIPENFDSSSNPSLQISPMSARGERRTSSFELVYGNLSFLAYIELYATLIWPKIKKILAALIWAFLLKNSLCMIWGHLWHQNENLIDWSKCLQKETGLRRGLMPQRGAASLSHQIDQSRTEGTCNGKGKCKAF